MTWAVGLNSDANFVPTQQNITVVVEEKRIKVFALPRIHGARKFP